METKQRFQVSTTNKNTGHNPIPGDIHAAARLMWESIPGIKHEEIAKALGLSRGTIQQWCSKEEWKAAGAPVGIEPGKMAIATVRREKRALKKDVLSPEDMRLLALRESRRMRDEKAQQMSRQIDYLTGRMLQAEQTGNRDQLANARVAADGISKLHKLQMQLWRIGEGEMPCMAKMQISAPADDE